MPKLYPLLIKPEFHERVWGTRDLRPVYDLRPEKPIGEAWLTGHNCRVQNGELAGRTLGELCREFGADLVGEAASQPDRFPMLIKFLFPREKLSVQVHPDDEMARSMGQPCGKTECWYVLSAEPGAQVGVGLKPGVTKNQFAEAIMGGNAEQLLNWIDIRPGELIYVEAGTVHAIGPGSILVETQQNSDTTFRLYDYGRPRELHVDMGLRATKEHHSAKRVTRAQDDAISELLAADCFRLLYCAVDDDGVEFGENNEGARSVEIVTALSGEGVIEVEGSLPVRFRVGEAVVVPAIIKGFSIRAAEGRFEALVTYVPRTRSTPSGGGRAKPVEVSS
jgi:mannose-6-phosphate isomerase